MTEVSQSTQPEHLSVYFEEIKPTDTLSPNGGRKKAEDGHLDVSDLLGIKRRALERGTTPAWALGVLAAEQFQSDLTITPEVKSAYAAIQENFEQRAGEIVLVLVSTPPKSEDYEGVNCFVGIIPEEITFGSDPYHDSIVMPGATGFHMIRRTDGTTTHLTGTGAQGELPLNSDLKRFDGFNLLDGRTFKESADSGTTEGSEAMLLNEREIVSALLEKCSPEMATELIIQLATALRDQSPERVKSIFGNIPEIAGHIESRRDMVKAYKAFFERVREQNETQMESSGSLEQLTANFDALRAKYKGELSALSIKYKALAASIAKSQIMYEHTRTWPYIDFDGHGTSGSLQRDYHDLKRENAEMNARIAIAEEILETIGLLQAEKEQS